LKAVAGPDLYAIDVVVAGHDPYILGRTSERQAELIEPGFRRVVFGGLTRERNVAGHKDSGEMVKPTADLKGIAF
jgi:hypothetical protein